jgi:hypothetical protein
VIEGQTMRPSIEVTLDPEPLDPRGELDAIVSGRWTFTLHTGAEQIATRGARTISARPARTRAREVVLAEHRCERGRA